MFFFPKPLALCFCIFLSPVFGYEFVRILNSKL